MQVRELIQATRPDVVVVELCKDRLGLLATDFPPGPRVWHCPRVQVTGVPEGAGFPKAEELQRLLTCKPGRPFSADDIEADVRTLQVCPAPRPATFASYSGCCSCLQKAGEPGGSFVPITIMPPCVSGERTHAARVLKSEWGAQATGLFGSVTPGATNATQQDAPLFLIAEDSDGSLRLDTVPPFANVEFRVVPRSLPQVRARLPAFDICLLLRSALLCGLLADNGDR